MSETRKCERGKDCGLPNVHCRAPECFAATPPTPDRAAVREADFAAAERYAHTAMQAGGPLLDNLARAYLALLRPAPLPADVQAVVERVEATTKDVEYRVRVVQQTCSRDPHPHIALPLRTSREFAADLRTLLAHLTREAR